MSNILPSRLWFLVYLVNVVRVYWTFCNMFSLQTGLPGIRLLDPAKNEPIESFSFKTVLRWEVSMFHQNWEPMFILDMWITLINSFFHYRYWIQICFFWVNNSITNRGFQLKSNSYTTTKICYAVAAAHYQVLEYHIFIFILVKMFHWYLLKYFNMYHSFTRSSHPARNIIEY